MSDHDTPATAAEQLEISLTDYEKALFCSGCEQEFDADETLYVADFGSAFPIFCSQDCAFDEAEKYRVEHLVDDRDGVEFVRLVERYEDRDT